MKQDVSQDRTYLRLILLDAMRHTSSRTTSVGVDQLGAGQSVENILGAYQDRNLGR